MPTTRLDWRRWGMDFWTSIGRHVGTSGLTWLGLGLKQGKVDWHDLWLALLVGAILPSIFTFLQTSPAPTVIVETETNTAQLTTTKTTTIEEKPTSTDTTKV